MLLSWKWITIPDSLPIPTIKLGDWIAFVPVEGENGCPRSEMAGAQATVRPHLATD
jgi:hypothetical protein